MRRRPSIACEIGSCKTTITSVLTRKAIPNALRLTPASSCANGGHELKSE